MRAGHTADQGALERIRAPFSKLGPSGGGDAWWVLVGLVTVVALVLRIPGVGQSLALDEMLTFGEIHAHPLTDLVHQMRAAGEDNPPLYYGLAWLTGQLGDDTVAIRLPSLILGTAAVPLTFALGARTVGRGPGALAAAFAAISPFAIFYSAEARGYATAMFFSVLATLALLRALRLRDWRWWAAYAAAVLALLYTHYTGVFVVAAQAGWALLLHRSQWRSILVATGAAGLAFAPWALTAKGGNFATVVGGPLHPTLHSQEALLAVFPGQPFSQILRPTLEQFPGVPALILVAGGIAVAAVGALVARSRREHDTSAPPPPRPILLLAALSVASPAGVFVYAVAKHDIYLSRYFSPSLPALLVLVGWLLTRPRGLLRVVPIALVAVGLLIGTAKTLEDRFRRPPLDDLAGFIRDDTRPGDTVVENPLVKLAFYTKPLHAYLGGTRSYSFDPRADSEVWTRAARGGRVAIVTADLKILPFSPPRWGPGLCFRQVARARFRGPIDPGAVVYGLGPRDRVCLAELPTFGAGFGPYGEDLAHQYHALLRPSGRIGLSNPGGRARTVRLTMTLDRLGAPAARVRIRYPGGSRVLLVPSRPPVPVRLSLRVPPGRSTISIATAGPPVAVPGEPGPVRLRVVDLHLD